MKLTKVLIGSLAVAGVATPFATLTSCGSSWGSLTPFSIGSTNPDSPLNPYYGIGVSGSTYKDADNQDIVPYLQSNYAIKSSTSTGYAYSSPMKFEDKDEKVKDDLWELGSSGWYASSDAKLASTATDKYEEEGKTKTRTVTNARNATLASNIDFVSTVGMAINNYLIYALQYQAQQLKAPEKGETLDETDIKIAWGNGTDKGQKFDLDHGTKDATVDSTNTQFYEYLFASANLNGKDAIKAMLRTSSVAFSFVDMPIPSYSFTGDDKETRQLSLNFIKLLEGADATIDTLKAPKYYSSKATDLKDEDEKTYKSYTYESVPVRIIVHGLKQTYLNPTKGTDSFVVNDYYSSNDEINEAVGNQWKDKMPIFTDLKEDECVPHYKTFEIATPGWTHSVTPAADSDKRIGDLYGNEFIGLINYQVNVFDDADMQKKNSATITAFSNLFPAYLLGLYDDVYKNANEDGDSEKVKIIDSNKINEIANKLLSLIRRSSSEGMKAHAKDLEQESKNLLAFLGYMFCGQDGETVKIEDIMVANKM